MTFADRAREDVNSMLASLVQFGYSKEASILQGQYEDLLQCVRQEMDIIWPQPGTQQTVESASRIPVR